VCHCQEKCSEGAWFIYTKETISETNYLKESTRELELQMPR
jgi:hypothetical protein